MKNWLARLFARPSQPAPAVTAPIDVVNPPPSFDLDLAFYRSLAGGQAILEAGQLEATPLAQALHGGDRLAKLRVLCDAGDEQAIELAASLSEGELRMFDKLGSDHE